MLQIFPFLVWVAALTSLVLMVLLWSLGELEPRGLVLVLGLFALAAYGQFFTASAIVRALGLLLQTMLAIYLLLRWKLSA